MITRRKAIGKSLFLLDKRDGRYYLVEYSPEGAFCSRPYDKVDEAIEEMRLADREGYIKGEI